jgi:tol-pal system protein YbgF
MKRVASLVLTLVGFSLSLQAQNQKEMTLALQRDIAALQDQIKQMQAAQNDRISAIGESLRNTLDLVTRINEKMAVMQTNTSDKLVDITRQVGAPTQALSQKVDGMNEQFQNLANTVAELNSRIGKLDGKMEDVKKMIQTIPPPAPVPATSQPQASNAISGEKLFDDANRDYLAGNYDLASRGFAEYLKSFPTTDRASDAQFYIAELSLRKKDYDTAIKGYDSVIDGYPDSNRVPNAHYMKGVALAKLERNSAAAKQFRVVIAKYPSTELARNSRDYLKALGVPVSQVPAKKRTQAAR